MGVHEDRGDLKKRGKKRKVTRPSSVVSPIKRDAVYLNEKRKNGLQKILTETTRKEKLK